MAFELTSVGAKVMYCIAGTAGTRPTSGYTELVGIKTAPEIKLSTETIDCSNLADRTTRYTPGRSDPGGEKEFTANNNAAFRTLWTALVTSATTAFAAGKETYFAYVVDGDSDAFYFTGMPQGLGHDGLDDNSLVTVSPVIVLTEIIGYATKPTT